MNTLIYTPRRCPPRRVLLTVIKTLALALFGIACMAIPFGVALAGNVAGIR